MRRMSMLPFRVLCLLAIVLYCVGVANANAVQQWEEKNVEDVIYAARNAYGWSVLANVKKKNAEQVTGPCAAAAVDAYNAYKNATWFVDLIKKALPNVKSKPPEMDKLRKEVQIIIKDANEAANRAKKIAVQTKKAAKDGNSTGMNAVVSFRNYSKVYLPEEKVNDFNKVLSDQKYATQQREMEILYANMRGRNMTAIALNALNASRTAYKASRRAEANARRAESAAKRLEKMLAKLEAALAAASEKKSRVKVQKTTEVRLRKVKRITRTENTTTRAGNEGDELSMREATTLPSTPAPAGTSGGRSNTMKGRQQMTQKEINQDENPTGKKESLATVGIRQNNEDTTTVGKQENGESPSPKDVQRKQQFEKPSIPVEEEDDDEDEKEEEEEYEEKEEEYEEKEEEKEYEEKEQEKEHEEKEHEETKEDASAHLGVQEQSTDIHEKMEQEAGRRMDAKELTEYLQSLQAPEKQEEPSENQTGTVSEAERTDSLSSRYSGHSRYSHGANIREMAAKILLKDAAMAKAIQQLDGSSVPALLRVPLLLLLLFSVLGCMTVC